MKTSKLTKYIFRIMSAIVVFSALGYLGFSGILYFWMKKTHPLSMGDRIPQQKPRYAASDLVQVIQIAKEAGLLITIPENRQIQYCDTTLFRIYDLNGVCLVMYPFNFNKDKFEFTLFIGRFPSGNTIFLADLEPALNSDSINYNYPNYDKTLNLRGIDVSYYGVRLGQSRPDSTFGYFYYGPYGAFKQCIDRSWNFLVILDRTAYRGKNTYRGMLYFNDNKLIAITIGFDVSLGQYSFVQNSYKILETGEFIWP